MTRVVKWDKNNLKKFEREMTKEMNKRIANVNRKLDPIRLSADSPNNLGDGITINATTNDNSVRINGDIHNSQVGGAQNKQQIITPIDVEGILREIRELSKTMTDEDDLNELTTILNSIQDSGAVSSGHKAFFEKHPLITIGVSAVISWVATQGLDSLIPIMQSVFPGATK